MSKHHNQNTARSNELTNFPRAHKHTRERHTRIRFPSVRPLGIFLSDFRDRSICLRRSIRPRRLPNSARVQFGARFIEQVFSCARACRTERKSEAIARSFVGACVPSASVISGWLLLLLHASPSRAFNRVERPNMFNGERHIHSHTDTHTQGSGSVCLIQRTATISYKL